MEYERRAAQRSATGLAATVHALLLLLSACRSDEAPPPSPPPRNALALPAPTAIRTASPGDLSSASPAPSSPPSVQRAPWAVANEDPTDDGVVGPPAAV